MDTSHFERRSQAYVDLAHASFLGAVEARRDADVRVSIAKEHYENERARHHADFGEAE